ncbi:transcriptional repressor [Oscillibacter hominis]|uniref:Transcriptional repressor n=1 Tax=Oscillibacter hominis TaxID=2763056 RepID=A0A7G9B2N4_9FIRM|nr:Fur family transcriptional regulator [Oscillibacter hominis]QNL43815.1 transcriptional repressor [Oscillibacter hominis]
MPYTTKQQRAVLSCIAAHQDGHVTAQELAEELHSQGESVGLATVYRHLERLEQSGRIHKISTEDGACYQYCDHPEGGCFLLKCERCGRIQHMDCLHLEPLYRHIAQEHRFVINPRKTMFYGLCETCAKEEKK